MRPAALSSDDDEGTGQPLTKERVWAAGGFGLFGFVGIVAGGLVAAVTGPLSWEHGSWAAAYLVLVVGVAQCGLGVGQAWLLRTLPPGRALGVELVAWNVGSALVIAGAVAEQPVLVDVGGVLLAVALVLFVAVVWGAREHHDAILVWARRCYLGLALVVLVSIPVGLVLAAGSSG